MSPQSSNAYTPVEGEKSDSVALAHSEAHHLNMAIDAITGESRLVGVKKTAQEVADFLLGTPRPAANTAAVAQQQLLDDVDISRHTVTNSEDDPNVRVLVDLEKKYAGNLEKLAKVRNLSVVERGGSRCMRFEKENFNLGLEDEQAETDEANGISNTMFEGKMHTYFSEEASIGHGAFQGWRQVLDAMPSKEDAVPILSIALAGVRVWSSGQYYSQGSLANYWSSSPAGVNSYFAYFNSGGGVIADSSYRAYGFSVRCVKN